MEQFTTIKITLQTRQLVRLVAATTGEKQYRVFLRLLLAEHEGLLGGNGMKEAWVVTFGVTPVTIKQVFEAFHLQDDSGVYVNHTLRTALQKTFHPQPTPSKLFWWLADNNDIFARTTNKDEPHGQFTVRDTTDMISDVPKTSP